jgi:hypothetical protein
VGHLITMAQAADASAVVVRGNRTRVRSTGIESANPNSRTTSRRVADRPLPVGNLNLTLSKINRNLRENVIYESQPFFITIGERVRSSLTDGT